MNESLEYNKQRPDLESHERVSRYFEVQFRISVLPTQENLIKAENVLRNFFEENNLSFEILSLNDSESLETLGWDGTNSQLDKPSTIDRRGGEVSFNIKYELKRNRFEKKLDDIKILMLEVWKKLYQAGVVTGYVIPQPPYQAINAQNGLLTPLSFGVSVPTHENKVKPYHSKFQITDEDLKQFDLHADFISMQTVRSQYILHQIEAAKERLKQPINSLKSDLKKLDKLLDTYVSNSLHRDSAPGFLNEHEKQYDDILELLPKLMPRQWDETLSLQPSIIKIQELWKNTKVQLENWRENENRKDSEKLSNARVALKTEFQQLLSTSKTLKEELKENYEKISDFLVTAGFTELDRSDKIRDLVENNPIAMQILYRNINHLKNQEESFYKYEQSFKSQKIPADQVSLTRQPASQKISTEEVALAQKPSLWAKHKSKILFGLSIGAGVLPVLLGVVGAVLTATGVLSPVGIPLTALGLSVAAFYGICAVVGVAMLAASWISYLQSKLARDNASKDINPDTPLQTESTAGTKKVTADNTYAGLLENSLIKKGKEEESFEEESSDEEEESLEENSLSSDDEEDEPDLNVEEGAGHLNKEDTSTTYKR